ncbi:MAG: NAD-dependent DNA ligase LigA [Planctomycetes bacterium]|nr:NAD-dependent DNA ligase LigA [Planctomycetota bacterium]
MSRHKLAAEIDALREDIRRHDRLYHVEAKPELTDLQYDKLLERLAKLEAELGEPVPADSPTQRVGGEPVASLTAVPHRRPMLSIDNTYSIEELKNYGKRVAKLLPGEPVEWVVELKIDGVACALTYENGQLIRGVTRGNGQVGDDITHNVRTLKDVPLKLQGHDAPPLIEIRGEVYMRNSDLVRLNQQREKEEEEPFANTRNVSAGTIRLLDPRICAERRLRMFCHGLGYAEGLQATTHMQLLTQLGQWGLSPTPHVECFPNFDKAVEHCEDLIERLHELDFEVDGLVLKVNSFEQRERLGSTAKSPRWVIAYKFEKFEGMTRLNDIRVQVGKSGTITPVAELEPLQLAGTTVSRASLHNAEEIERKDIRVGDMVVVEKAGKIIPHIVRVEKHRREKPLKPFHFPTECPECGSNLVKDEHGVYIRCPNQRCGAQVKERVRYFATRNAMDIEGLGDKLVELLVNEKLVQIYGDLYRLTVEQVSGLERMGRKSAENLIAGVAASKDRGLARLLNALSIRHVGRNVAMTLAAQFGSMEKLRQADVEQLSATPDVGEVIAQSVFDYLHSPYGEEVVDDLAALGVRMTADAATKAAVQGQGVLGGKTLVVTGTLNRYSRDEIQDLIAKHGGHATSSVSKSTDYVVAGEKAGSKLEKAQKLGVKVLTEEEFEKLIGGALA